MRCGEIGMSDDYNERMTEQMSAEDKKYYGDYETQMRAERDAELMIEYMELKNDKKRMKMAMHCAQQKMKALKEVTNA